LSLLNRFPGHAACADGYRFPKHQGKPAFHESGNPRQMRVFAIRVRPAPARRSDSIHRDT
jgi:hypothetical protein